MFYLLFYWPNAIFTENKGTLIAEFINISLSLMHLKYYSVFLFICLLAITACKKKPNPTPDPTTDTGQKKVTDVYIAGISLDANNKQAATYWKNGVASTVAPVNSG